MPSTHATCFGRTDWPSSGIKYMIYRYAYIFRLSKTVLSTPWRHIVGVEVQIHSFLMWSGIDTPWAGRSENKIPVRALFCPHSDRPWGPHNPLYNWYRAPFLEVKRPGRGVDRLPPSSTDVKERVKPYFYCPSGLPWPILGWTLQFNNS